MSAVATAVIGAAVIGGVVASDSSRKASHAQSDAANAGISVEQSQFDQIKQLLAPYVTAGTGALSAQQNLIGLGGADQQQAAIDALKNGPEFQAYSKLGENSILANASATGGLRGGNTEAALAQFQPQLLAGLINNQYSRLGGLTAIGQNAAAGVGNAGMQTATNQAGLLQQQGAATAGNDLAQGQIYQNILSSIVGGLTMGKGLGSATAPSGGASTPRF